ncbi:MAG: hypothetical protein Q7P63_11710 [Verrucomicrobiota bacterium JB022]|nr:hypothetical protein [Verrucomicrobiota bacterium JB022]
MSLFTRIGVILVGLLGLALTGCTTAYYVSVDSMSRPDALQPSAEAGNLQYYTLESSDPKVQPGDLRFTETAQYLEAALAGAGYIYTTSPSEADVIVTFDTELKGPIRSSETSYEPVYYSRPSYTRVAIVNKKGNVVGYSWAPGPYYTDVVHQRYDRTVSLYQKSLTLSARARNADGKPGEELWNVTARSTDQSGDLRAYTPVLAAAAMNYIGQETNGEQRLVLKEDSEMLRYVRQGL